MVRLSCKTCGKRWHAFDLTRLTGIVWLLVFIWPQVRWHRVRGCRVRGPQAWDEEDDAA